MENASPITALALGVGNRQSGCSGLTQMQNHPGTNKPPMSQRFDFVPGRPPAPECKFALASPRDDTFPPSLLPFGFCCWKLLSV